MIEYIKGNLFDNLTTPSCIVHIVNNRGFWGAGFTAGLDEHFPLVKKDYIGFNEQHTLGMCLRSSIGENSKVLHLVAQTGVYDKQYNTRPLNYEALYQCLEESGKYIQENYSHLNVVMPKIGSGLARGNFKIISTMIEELYDFPVTVFEL